MSVKQKAHKVLVTRILEGHGTATHAQRHAAFNNDQLTEPLSTLIEKVATHPTQVTDEDISAVTAAGLTEDQIFELVVCAAVGQATRQYQAALHALAEATNDARGSGDAT